MAEKVVLGKYSSLLLDLDSEPSIDVPVAEAFLPWRLKTFSFKEFWSHTSTTQLSDVQLAYLAYFGVLCPTTHNTVPQRFILSAGTQSITIVVDRQFILPASDKDGRQGTISIGCCLENILAASQVFGLDYNLEFLATSLEQLKPYSSENERYTPVVKASFTKSNSAVVRDQSWLRAIKARKVIRAESDESHKLSQSQVAEMKKIVTDMSESMHLSVITDAQTKQLIGVFQEQAMGTVLNRDDFSLELGHWLLPDSSDSDIGIRGAEMGLSPQSGLRFHKGLLREEQLEPIEIQSFARGEREIVRSASGIGVISIETDNPQLRMAAGRGLEKLILNLYLQGFSTSIQAAATEVDIGTTFLKARLFIHNRQDVGRPVVVFSIGRPKLSSDSLRPHAARPVLEKILLDPTSH